MNARDAATGVGSNPEPEQPPEPIAELPETVRSITVDGRLDDPDWRAADPLTFTDPDDESDNEVDLRGVWDAESLYLGWRVDDASVESTESTPPYREDAVEFFLDPEENGGYDIQSDDLHVVVSTEKEVLAKLGGEDVDAIGLNSAIVEADDGYTVELKVDWEPLGLEPAPESTIRALFANADRDDGSALQFAEPNIHPFAQPSRWLPVELVGARPDRVPERDPPGGEEGAGPDTGSTPDAGSLADTGSTGDPAETPAGDERPDAETSADTGPAATESDPEERDRGCSAAERPSPNPAAPLWLALLGFGLLALRRGRAERG